MGPGNYEFGQVRDYLERQQRRIAELEGENRRLRRELDELRRGVGIAVMIHGRAVPLAPLPPASTVANPRPSTTTSGQHPAVAPMPSGPISSAVSGPQAQPMPAAASFPEANWLTGSQPAIRAQPRPERIAESRQASALRASERITPDWLREATAGQAPANGQQVTQDAAHTADVLVGTPPQSAATPSHFPATPSQPGEWPTSRSSRSRRSHASAPLPPLPLPPLPLPTEPPYPSLAELTGQRPAVQRRPRHHANDRSPYDDSFVLG